MNNEYLSDEELLKLIDEVEENAMLRAPAYLKQRILTEIQEMDSADQMPARQSIQKYKKNIRRQLLVYELKIAGLVAAAILLLFLIPVSVPKEPPVIMEEDYSQDSGFLYHWNEASGKMLQYINITSNALLHPDEFFRKLQSGNDTAPGTKGE